MAIPDPLTLPSGGTVTFRDPDAHFKRAHFRRLSATITMAADGRASLADRSEESWRAIDVMAEALIESWTGPDDWYLYGRPVPSDGGPAVLDDVSSADLRALGHHLLPLAWGILGFVRKDEDDDEGKGVPPSAASNGSTPTSGSDPSTGPTTAPEIPAAPETSLSAGSPTL
jgi:hypothetical protein